MEIKKTKDYDKFKFIDSNRLVNEYHVKRLINSISNRDLSDKFPILVNNNLEIIDGQHRFTALKKMKKPIYYIKSDNFELNDIKLVNTNSKNWGTKEYLNHYIKLGNEDYIRFNNLMEFHQMKFSYALELFSNNSSHNRTQDFKVGNLILKKDDLCNELADNFNRLISNYNKYSIYTLRAYIYLVKKGLNIKKLLEKMEKMGKRYYAAGDIKSELRLFQDILNLYKKNNKYLFAEDY